jgi:hypothetical protein
MEAIGVQVADSSPAQQAAVTLCNGAHAVHSVVNGSARHQLDGGPNGGTSIMTNKSLLLALAIGMPILAGCQTQGQILANDQDTAVQTALRRARFELNCPDATASVLSSEMLQPALWGGMERAEYTVGISGCSKRAVYLVVCPNSGGCFAASGRGNDKIVP